jgi:hypothetical protein
MLSNFRSKIKKYVLPDFLYIFSSDTLTIGLHNGTNVNYPPWTVAEKKKFLAVKPNAINMIIYWNRKFDPSDIFTSENYSTKKIQNRFWRVLKSWKPYKFIYYVFKTWFKLKLVLFWCPIKWRKLIKFELQKKIPGKSNIASESINNHRMCQWNPNHTPHKINDALQEGQAWNSVVVEGDSCTPTAARSLLEWLANGTLRSLWTSRTTPLSSKRPSSPTKWTVFGRPLSHNNNEKDRRAVPRALQGEIIKQFPWFSLNLI